MTAQQYANIHYRLEKNITSLQCVYDIYVDILKHDPYIDKEKLNLILNSMHISLPHIDIDNECHIFFNLEGIQKYYKLYSIAMKSLINIDNSIIKK